jgi:hypothetical protein
MILVEWCFFGSRIVTPSMRFIQELKVLVFSLGFQSKRPHRNHRKVTRNAEIAIVVLREAFNWGTQRIAVNLQSPPPYIITLP